MDRPGGYNPMRWNCKASGCYNETLRPRIEDFADCFPGRIGMSDVDGVVEIGGWFLFIEWKSQGGSVQTGQRIMFEQLTALSPKMTVIVVSGHPREMTVKTVQVFQCGKACPPEPSDIEGLKARIKAWAGRAQMDRIRPSKRIAA